MNRALQHIRKETLVGRHLHECFADSKIRQIGWKKMQDARRIARRLKLENIYA